MATKIPVEINKFLGINENEDGQTQLLLGESPNMVNWRVTENFKLKKRYGYEPLFDNLGSEIKGMWYGSINGTYHFLFACNGHIYEHDLTLGTNIDLGTLTDAKTFFFAFNDALYIMNGYEYKKWTGTGNIVDVVGYRPKIAIGTPPSGGGTLYEDINLLTGSKHQTFSADGTATAYFIAEQAITSIDFVKVNGETKTLSTDYTQDLTLGKITFTTAPITGQDNVDIGWTKGTGQRDLVYKNRKALIFGGQSDSRVHIFGNVEKKNFEYFSALANELPSAEYFTEFNYNLIGSNEYAITDIIRQYDRAIIFTEKDTWYTYYDAITDVNGNTIASFPVYPLNAEKGCEAFGQSQLILNNPFSIYKGVYEWVSTAVRDERNAVYKSRRVQSSLDTISLKDAITFDNEDLGEYWLIYQNKAWIYNYRIDVWFKFEFYDSITSMISINKKVYFGTTSGQIMEVNKSLLSERSDNGQPINTTWEMGFYDVGNEWLRKFLNKTWISLKPENKSKVDVYWETNRDGSVVNPTPISYNNLDFSRLDFRDFSFLTNYNPQPFRIKTKAKKWVYFKLILKNNSDTYTATVLSINLLPRIGGESK